MFNVPPKMVFSDLFKIKAVQRNQYKFVVNGKLNLIFVCLTLIPALVCRQNRDATSPKNSRDDNRNILVKIEFDEQLVHSSRTKGWTISGGMRFRSM